LPETAPVWKVKSLRAIVVGGYALTITDVTMPKLPRSVRQSLQLVTTVLENVPGPPPRIAKNRSEFSVGSACTNLPSAVTTSKART
jgi:hypothetical protein